MKRTRSTRTDANQPQLVAYLRNMGATVHITASLGGEVLDLVVGYAGVTALAEVKDPQQPPSKQRLTDDEQLTFDTWRGGAPFLLTGLECCRRMLGEMARGNGYQPRSKGTNPDPPPRCP